MNLLEFEVEITKMNGNNGIKWPEKMNTGRLKYSELSHFENWQNPEFYLGVERDYTGKYTKHPMNIRFDSRFPRELKGAVSESIYVNTIEEINRFYAEGEAKALTCCAIIGHLMSYVTCKLSLLCSCQSPLEKANDDISKFLEDENSQIYHPIGLHVLHPMERGLRRIVIKSTCYGSHSVVITHDIQGAAETKQDV